MSNQGREFEDRLTRHYLAQGYTVEHQAQLAGSDLTADLLLRRGDEVVLVQCKYTGGPPRDTSLKELAEYAERQGWRFSVVLGQESGAVEEISIPSREEVLRLIADAHTVNPSSWIALLAVFAAFEAAARYALSRTGQRSPPRPTSGAQVQALAVAGLITPEDERLLRKLMAARNTAAHGLSHETVPAELVESALTIAETLITTTPPDADSPPMPIATRNTG